MVQEFDKHQFKSIFVVFRRLQKNFGKNQILQVKIPVYGQISVNETEYFNNKVSLSKLIRITEIVKDSNVLERQVDASNIWIDEETQNGNKVYKKIFIII